MADTSPGKRRFNNRAIEANALAVKQQFLAIYGERNPVLARMGAKIGAAFIEALLDQNNAGVPVPQVHQAIHFLAAWMLAQSTADGAKNPPLRTRLNIYAMTQVERFLDDLAKNPNIDLPEAGEEVRDGDSAGKA